MDALFAEQVKLYYIEVRVIDDEEVDVGLDFRLEGEDYRIDEVQQIIDGLTTFSETKIDHLVPKDHDRTAKDIGVLGNCESN